MSSTCPHNIVNFGLRAAEIGLPVWGNPLNFNGLRVLAALQHGSKVVSVSQTLRRWTEGAIYYVRQGDHHVGHWPTFLVVICNVGNVEGVKFHNVRLNTNIESFSSSAPHSSAPHICVLPPADHIPYPSASPYIGLTVGVCYHWLSYLLVYAHFGASLLLVYQFCESFWVI